MYRVTTGWLSKQGIDYQIMKCRLHKILMEHGKSTGNWSLRLGNWTVWMQMEIGLGKTFSGISVSGDTRFSGGKRGKNKDCFGNKQYFFSKFRKILLDKGFKFPDGGFEGLFFFSVEPPFRGRLFHQGVDIPHSYQVPDAF
jgi:hypothetical protein